MKDEAGKGVADRFLAELGSRIDWIAETGFNGASRDRISPGLRLDVYKDRCIYFRADAETVTILRVVHGAMDVTAEEIAGE